MELYKVLKDHKNPFMEELVRCSYRSSFAKEMEGTGGAEILCSQDLAYYRSDIHREATETTSDIDDRKTLTQGGYAAHDVKYQPVPMANAHYLIAKAELWSRRPIRYGQEAENVLLPKPAPAEEEGFGLDEEARHGLCCLGSAEGHGVQRRRRITEL